MQDEIFGPILPIIPYKTLDDAIACVNAKPRPLALYVFSDDRGVVEQVLERTTSGNATVNDTLLHYAQDDLPFGGVGSERHGRLSRRGRLPVAQPCQGRFRPVALELRRPVAGAVWPGRRLASIPAALSRNPAPIIHRSRS